KFVNTKTEGGKVMVIPGSEFILPCDMVILATGQSRHKALFELIPGIELTSAGNLKCNASFQTSNPRYFAAGDIASGGEEVVNAVADGKKAAMGIIEWLDK
ncbi:MAG TPA: FAD-dependent oxidoreductase, partial [Saprospiraceae bacterium]|nr:FAD-dependent oxidoreductase [Saprospiraceae bacterium]